MQNTLEAKHEKENKKMRKIKLIKLPQEEALVFTFCMQIWPTIGSQSVYCVSQSRIVLNY